MGGTEDPRVRDALRAFLADRNRSPDLVKECLVAIAEYDGSYARPIFLEVLADRSRDEESRRIAAILLLKSGQTSDVETVLEQAVGQVESPSLTEELLSQVLRGTVNGVVSGSAQEVETRAELHSVRGRSCVRKLENLAKDRRQPTKVRLDVLMVLRGIADPNSSWTLGRLATDKAEDRDIRERAFSALAEADPSRAGELCWTLLKQRPPGFPVEYIVASLADQGDEAIVRLVKRAGDLPEVQDALIRRGYASRLPKEQAIERTNILLGEREQEYYYETLMPVARVGGGRGASSTESPRVYPG